MKASQCGWVIPPDDPQALAQALFKARSISVEERDWHGMHGREYALKNLTEEINLPKVVSILERIPYRRDTNDKGTRSPDAR
jgi:glycosyltransferase involved in cell wall biosynthesis